jgi:hypothetical protein
VFSKSNDAEFTAGIAFLNCHDAIIFDLRLQMSILRRLLPKRVNFRLARFFNDLRKARGFDFEQFHKKSARGLRQRGSNYRCCIPALAGFVSPQSIAPDGEETYRKACPEQQLALSEVEYAEWIDIVQSGVLSWRCEIAAAFVFGHRSLLVHNASEPLGSLQPPRSLQSRTSALFARNATANDDNVGEPANCGAETGVSLGARWIEQSLARC